MNEEFWTWMNRKGYDRIGCNNAGIHLDRDAFEDECNIWFDSCAVTGIGNKLPEQLLIGFQIEYLTEQGSINDLFKLLKKISDEIK